MHRFYKELYTSTGANSDDQRFDTFVNNPVLPEISADQKQSCEGLLTKAQADKALCLRPCDVSVTVSAI